jgi:hypothetical protein
VRPCTFTGFSIFLGTASASAAAAAACEPKSLSEAVHLHEFEDLLGHSFCAGERAAVTAVVSAQSVARCYLLYLSLVKCRQSAVWLTVHAVSNKHDHACQAVGDEGDQSNVTV